MKVRVRVYSQKASSYLNWSIIQNTHNTVRERRTVYKFNKKHIHKKQKAVAKYMPKFPSPLASPTEWICSSNMHLQDFGKSKLQLTRLEKAE